MGAVQSRVWLPFNTGYLWQPEKILCLVSPYALEVQLVSGSVSGSCTTTNTETVTKSCLQITVWIRKGTDWPKIRYIFSSLLQTSCLVFRLFFSFVLHWCYKVNILYTVANNNVSLFKLQSDYIFGKVCVMRSLFWTKFICFKIFNESNVI